MTIPVEIISFGYGHGAAPEAHITMDLRHHFRDPHVDPSLRELTASDPAVMDAVYATPGVLRLAASIALAAQAYGHGPQPGPVTVAIGCAGGRHRAPAIADKVAYHLEIRGVPVTLTHRDMHRAVIGRPVAAGAA